MGKKNKTKQLFIKEYCYPLVTKSCQILCSPMDCSSPHSSVHGIFQVRILEWVAISFSRGSSWPGDRIPCPFHWQTDSFPLSSQGPKRICRWQRSKSLIIKEMQIKTTVWYHYMPLRMAKIRQRWHQMLLMLQRKDPSWSVGGNVKWHIHFGKQFGNLSQN